MVGIASGNRHSAGADQPAAGRSRERPFGTISKMAEGLVLPAVRGHAPARFATVFGRWLRPQGAAPAADGVWPELVGLPVVQFDFVPHRRAGHRTGPQGAGRHGGRCPHSGPGDDKRRPRGP